MKEIRFEKADWYLFAAFGVGMLILLLLAFFGTGCGGAPFSVLAEHSAPDVGPIEAGGAYREDDAEGGAQDAPQEAAPQPPDSGVTEILDDSPGAPEAASDAGADTSPPETACDIQPVLPYGCMGCNVNPRSCVLTCESCPTPSGGTFLWPSLQLPCPSKQDYIALDSTGRLVCQGPS